MSERADGRTNWSNLHQIAPGFLREHFFFVHGYKPIKINRCKCCKQSNTHLRIHTLMLVMVGREEVHFSRKYLCASVCWCTVLRFFTRTHNPNCDFLFSLHSAIVCVSVAVCMLAQKKSNLKQFKEIKSNNRLCLSFGRKLLLLFCSPVRDGMRDARGVYT